MMAALAELRQATLLLGAVGIALIGVVILCTLLVLRANRRRGREGSHE
ncbi:MAG: hypothetical protein M5U14_19675 [Acidimicrobiia bacterium]|nr:hypothetical protein [Acidimicrobiia bacterium]